MQKIFLFILILINYNYLIGKSNIKLISLDKDHIQVLNSTQTVSIDKFGNQYINLNENKIDTFKISNKVIVIKNIANATHHYILKYNIAGKLVDIIWIENADFVDLSRVIIDNDGTVNLAFSFMPFTKKAKNNIVLHSLKDSLFIDSNITHSFNFGAFGLVKLNKDGKITKYWLNKNGGSLRPLSFYYKKKNYYLTGSSGASTQIGNNYFAPIKGLKSGVAILKFGHDFTLIYSDLLLADYISSINLAIDINENCFWSVFYKGKITNGTVYYNNNTSFGSSYQFALIKYDSKGYSTDLFTCYNGDPNQDYLFIRGNDSIKNRFIFNGTFNDSVVFTNKSFKNTGGGYKKTFTYLIDSVFNATEIKSMFYNDKMWLDLSVNKMTNNEKDDYTNLVTFSDSIQEVVKNKWIKVQGQSTGLIRYNSTAATLDSLQIIDSKGQDIMYGAEHFYRVLYGVGQFVGKTFLLTDSVNLSTSGTFFRHAPCLDSFSVKISNTLPTICLSDSAHIKLVNPVPNLAQSVWYLNDQPIYSKLDTFINAKDSGSYKLLAINDSGCYSFSNSLKIDYKHSSFNNIVKQFYSTCTGDTLVTFIPNQSNITYQWFDTKTKNILSKDTLLRLTKNTKYHLRASSTISGCVRDYSIDSANFYPKPSQPKWVNKINNALCDKDSLTLKVDNLFNYTNAIWLKNDTFISSLTDSDIVISKPSKYSYLLRNKSCLGTKIDTFIYHYNKPNKSLMLLGKNPTCKNDSTYFTTLDTLTNFISLAGRPLKRNFAKFKIDLPGIYSYKTLSKDGCFSIDTLVSISINKNPIKARFLYQNDTLLAIKPLTDSISWFYNNNYLGILNNYIYKPREGKFYVITSNGNCTTSSDTFLVKNSSVWSHITSPFLFLSLQPNPSNGDFNLSYQLQEHGKVTADVVDMNGRVLCKVLDLANQTAGIYNSNVSCANLAQGVYTLRFVTNQNVIYKRMMVVSH